MQAFVYLLLTKLKNNLKQLVKSPVKMIYTVCMVVVLVLVAVTSTLRDDMPSTEYQDIRILIAGIFALYTLLFYLIVNTGFNTGASIFKLPDVNMIFVAPFRPRQVLMYGLFQQLGTTAITGLFLIFQYGWISNSFGVTVLDMLFIMLGYSLNMFLAQLIAMLIYSVTNQNEKIKKAIKVIVFLPVIILCSFFVLQAVDAGGFSMNLLIDFGESFGVKYFPVTGWVTDILRGILAADSKMLILGILLTAAILIVIVIMLFVIEMDYYEDVLQTAEVTYASVTAAKEGRTQEAAPRNVKTGKTGLTKGNGASVFYYKHMIENRRAKSVFLPVSCYLFVVMIIVFSFFMKEIGIIPIIAFGTYMQMFSVAMGRFPKELTKPFIYLVPETSFKKLLYCLKEAIPGYLVEAVVLFVPVGLIMKLSPIEIAACILLRMSFSFLFIVGNIATERIFGFIGSKVMILFFYMFLLIIFSLPGIILAAILVVSEIILVSEIITIAMSMIVCNILVALVALFLCRNMLEYAELNN